MASEWQAFVASVASNDRLPSFCDLAHSVCEALHAGNKSYAYSAARTLLEHAELPLVLRASVCRVLATSDVPDYLEMAHEAVRIAEIANNDPNAGELEAELLRDCQSIFRRAQRGFGEVEQTVEADLPGQNEETGPLHAAGNAADILASDRAAAHDAANLDIRGRDSTT